jgi:predicted restriction endonuclease
LELHGGFFYRTADGSPTVEIAEKFETMIRQRLSSKLGRNVPFQFNRKDGSWRRELKTAEKLLAECEHSRDLAIDTVQTLFDHKDFQWKVYASISSAVKDFAMAKAITLALWEEDAQNANDEAQRFEDIQRNTNPFNYGG